MGRPYQLQVRNLCLIVKTIVYLFSVSTGLELVPPASHDSLASLLPGRHYDMWIDGSDIRFMRCTLPEMKYMFHALYTHVPDETPGHPVPYGTADKLQKRSYMCHVRQLLAEHEMGS